MVAPAGALSEWLPSSERLVFQGESVLIGRVRCPPASAHFRNCGEARTFCIVFPRSAVIIRRPNQPQLVEDPSVVTFYNRAQEYERFELSPEGDRCDWFAYSPDVVRDAVRQFDPAAAADERNPLRLISSRSSLDVFRHQRLLFERVRNDHAIDPLYVEEMAIALLDRVVGDAYAKLPESNISLAFDLGFSTHSHFTAAFKREFGTTPSGVRAAVAASPRPSP
jgi:hypothetical protein